MTTRENYQELVSRYSIKSPILKNCALAFVFGGSFSLIGEILGFLYKRLEISAEGVANLTSVTLIFIAAMLTAFGLYDKLAKYGGAGTLIPITGFANAVAAPIMEFRDEGYILGIGTKFFVVAGPVISWGAIGSCAFGILYYLYKIMLAVIR